MLEQFIAEEDRRERGVCVCGGEASEPREPFAKNKFPPSCWAYVLEMTKASPVEIRLGIGTCDKATGHRASGTETDMSWGARLGHQAELGRSVPVQRAQSRRCLGASWPKAMPTWEKACLSLVLTKAPYGPVS